MAQSCILDIIANNSMLNRYILGISTFNPKVVQSTGNFHNKIIKHFFCISEKIFDNSTPFDP